MKREGIASDNQRKLAAQPAQDEAISGEPGHAESIPPQALLARVLERENLQRALKQVRQNKGAPGIDGMTVDALPEYLQHHWLNLRDQLIAGTYKPQPVRRVEIPKPDGTTRPLGIPTVLDRFIQQAIAQVISAQWEPRFHPHSYGFRPQRSAHQAVRHVQAHIRQGWNWVVDMDLQAFFDRVNHDRLMSGSKVVVTTTACCDSSTATSRPVSAWENARKPPPWAYRKAARSPLCWPTLCWMNWIGNWTGAATALRATRMTAISWSEVSVQVSGS